MLTHYNSSKGAKEIATMPLPYARNALAKLLDKEPERTAEIEALTAHVDRLEAEAAESDTDAPVRDGPAPIGDNKPPADDAAPSPTGRSAIDAHVDGLLAEAANWADGFVIDNQEQADAVGRLMRQLQQAAKLVDDNAAEEKKPHNEAIAKIAEWQNGYTSKGKKTIPDGKLTKAILACGNMSTAWLTKKDEERRQREAEAAAAAQKAAQEAIAAREEAKTSTDLADMDKADDMLASAEDLLRQAKGVSKERVGAGGGEGTRSLGLRSYWRAEITNQKAALLHYLAQQPEAFRELIQTLADRDARNEATRRNIPGVTFHDDKRAA